MKPDLALFLLEHLIYTGSIRIGEKDRVGYYDLLNLIIVSHADISLRIMWTAGEEWTGHWVFCEYHPIIFDVSDEVEAGYIRTSCPPSHREYIPEFRYGAVTLEGICAIRDTFKTIRSAPEEERIVAALGGLDLVGLASQLENAQGGKLFVKNLDYVKDAYQLPDCEEGRFLLRGRKHG